LRLGPIITSPKLEANSNMSSTIFIIVDNLRVGGVQRLALDEAYVLSRRGFEVRIFVLEPMRQEDDICKVDADYFELYRDQIHIAWINSGRISTVAYLREEIKRFTPSLIISHSAKGIFISKMSTVGVHKKIRPKVIGFLHQLIPLSDRLQKIKRMFFFQFADDFRASSMQFILELSRIRNENYAYRLILRREPWFDRMGIDLERIEYQQRHAQTYYDTRNKSLIFLSRVVGWKGFKTYYDLCMVIEPQTHKVILASPMYSRSTEIEMLKKLTNHHLLLHRGIASVVVGSQAIHIYPASYGGKVKCPQNIGLNVLECLALGVPSLISDEQFWSWPELKDSPLIVTTNWSTEDALNKIEALFGLEDSVKRQEQTRILPLISIDSHIQRLLDTNHI